MAYTATVPELMRKYSTTDLDNAFTLFDSDKDKPADLRARWTVPAWALDVMLERASCLYSEHTWGFSCYRDRKRFQDPDWRERYDRGEFKHIDDSFDYHMKYARRAYTIAQDGIKKRMEALARSVDVEGPRVVVFNPLPYARDAVVEVEIPEGYSLPGGVREGCKVKFLAKGLPPGGYKTFNPYLIGLGHRFGRHR